MYAITASLRKIFLIALSITALHAVPEPVGYYAVGSKARVMLLDETDGQQTLSGWLNAEENFAGYRLDKINAKNQKLTLSKDGKRTTIDIRPPKTAKNSVLLAGNIKIQNTFIKDVQVWIEAGTDLSIELTEKTTLSLKNKLLNDGSLLHTARFSTTKNDGTIERSSGYTYVQKPKGPIILDVGDYVIELEPLE